MNGCSTIVEGGLEKQYDTKYNPHSSARKMNLTVAENIDQGMKLQQKKKLTFAQTEKPLNVIGEGKDRFRKYATKQSFRSSTRQPSMSESYTKKKAITSFERFSSGRLSGSDSNYTPTSRPLRCPLRIAELAEPSKRQCIETWRSRNDILPPFMLERLKRHVTNQKVVARVTDAVECFKTNDKYSPPLRSPQMRKAISLQVRPLSPRNRTKSPRQAQADRSQLRGSPVKYSNLNNDIREFCGVFAQLIALKLIRPENRILCKDFEKLSHTVAVEITRLIQKKRKNVAAYCFDNGILKEMSDKITLWIADVLRDSELKLMEDDLRAKKEANLRSGKNDTLITLMEKYNDNKTNMTEDLEEEEGPVLDVVDTLISNVMDICSISSEMDSTYVSPDETTNLNASEDLKKAEENSEKDVQLWKNESLESVPGIHNIPRDANRTDSENTDSKYEISIDTNEVNDSDAKYSTAEVLNVSDDNLVNLEESLDERKKVKFTDLDGSRGGSRDGTGESNSRDGTGTSNGRDGTGSMGGSGGGGSINSGGTGYSAGSVRGAEHSARIGDSTSGIIEGLPKRKYGSSLEKSSSESISSHKKASIYEHLNPPKHSILSIVDESWPNDLDMNQLRPSASVSKSITSLGNIFENDEHNLEDSTFLINNNLQNVAEGQLMDSSSNKEKDISNNSSIIIEDPSEEIIQTITSNIRPKPGPVTIEDERPQKHNISEKQGAHDEKDVFRVASPILTPVEANIVEKVEPDRKSLKDDITTKEKAKRHSEPGHRCDTAHDPPIDTIRVTTCDKRAFKHVGKGDHNNRPNADSSDTEAELNKMLKSIKERINKPKFDYRVHPQTAPSWARINDTSDESLSAKNRPIRNIGSSELRKWCKDMDHTLGNLQEWKDWLQMTCKKVLLHKQQSDVDNLFCQESRIQNLRHWTQLKKSIDKDAIVWRKLNQRTLEVLKHYEMTSKPKNALSRRVSPKMHRKNRTKKPCCSLEDTIYTIEGLSLWLHRSIVSAEYCVGCSCKKFQRKFSIQDDAPSCSGRSRI